MSNELIGALKAPNIVLNLAFGGMKLQILVLLAFWGACCTTGEYLSYFIQHPSDKEVIAACLVLEAGGEGRQGMHAVMNVVQNRSKYNTNKFYEEAIRPYQFTSLNSGNVFPFKDFRHLVRKAKASPVWETAVEIVDLAYKGQLADITQGATHFYATNKLKTPPDWAEKLSETVIIGNHRFMQEPQKLL